MNLPKEGWKEVDCIDLGVIREHCDLCGATIRFKHILSHYEYGIISIGCECAGRVMSGESLDYVKDSDKVMKSRAEKIKRIRKKWIERNQFYASRGLPEVDWETYLMAWNVKEE